MGILYFIRREEGEKAARETLRLIDTFPVEYALLYQTNFNPT